MTVGLVCIDNKIRINHVTIHKTNHVLSVKTIGRRDLAKTFHKLKYGNYSPKTFSALTLTYKDPDVTIICFSTGNFTIMGTTTYHGALLALYRLKKSLNLNITSVKLTNIVFKFDISNFKKDQYTISDVYASNMKNAVCDIENFPSCTYSIPDSNIKANIFDSGKIVVAGCNDMAKIRHVVNEIVHVMHKLQDGHRDKNLEIKK